jgi:nucleotide-binding universal stress UspA family protein
MLALPLSGKTEARVGTPALLTRPMLLLASDGSAAASAATQVTAALARTRGDDVRVISVLPSQLYQPAFPDAGSAAPIDEFGIRQDTETRQGLVREQIAVAGVRPDQWPLDIEIGPPATVIAREARRRLASMVTIGLRHHGAVERLLRDETTLRVVRESPVPVLAVTSTLTDRPRRVAVAVDFSRASLRAARTAIGLLGPGGSLFVVYVAPEVHRGEEHEGASIIHSQGIVAAFARLRRELMVPGGIQIEAVMLNGQPGAELLSFAERADIDLIAVGSHRHPFLTHLLLGSVTSTLVRDARRSLLVSPPAPVRDD